MKRFLYNSYKNSVPERVKRAIPESLKAQVSRLLFALTQHPDFAFIDARHLATSGQDEKCRRLYMPQVKPTTALHDPLFLCDIKKSGRSYSLICSGRFRAEFGFHGLKINGHVRQHDQSVKAPGSKYIEILLDGHVLRRERLNFSGDSADFSFTIKRTALDLFPAVSALEIRCSNGGFLPSNMGGSQLILEIPHGRGEMFERLAATGTLDKKGYPRLSATDLRKKQNDYLELYARARKAFEDDLGRPLFLLYGTLLGQHREGDFIPGDDDFDVGYVSEHTDLSAIKAEAIVIMERLIELGFTVLLNREGKPHRLRDDISGAELHLDNRPVFTRDDGHVWMHKNARLNMDIEDFRQVEIDRLQNTVIYKPRGTEAFLEAYYGPNWQVPDPGYTNANRTVNRETSRCLRSICISHSEQKDLLSRIEEGNMLGKFIPISLQSPYPLDIYFGKVGY